MLLRNATKKFVKETADEGLDLDKVVEEATKDDEKEYGHITTGKVIL